jgi:hypothetical protein
VLIAALQAWAWSFPILLFAVAGLELEFRSALLIGLGFFGWTTLQYDHWNASQMIMSLATLVETDGKLPLVFRG